MSNSSNNRLNIVGSQAAYAGALAAVTGGRLGDSKVSLVIGNSPTTHQALKHILLERFVMDENAWLFPNSPQNPDDLVIWTAVPTTVPAIPDSLQPLYDANSMGHVPVRRALEVTYPIAEKATAYAVQSSWMSASLSKVSGGQTDVEGNTFAASVNVLPDRLQIGPTGLAAVVDSSHDHFAAGQNVWSELNAVSVGSCELHEIAGNFVQSDRSGSIVFKASVPADDIQLLVASERSDASGRSQIPQYYSGPVELHFTNLSHSGVDTAMFVQLIYASVEPDGTFVFDAVNVTLFASDAQGDDTYEYIPNPTHVGGKTGFPSFLLAITAQRILGNGMGDNELTVKFSGFTPDTFGPTTVFTFSGYEGQARLQRCSHVQMQVNAQLAPDYAGNYSLPASFATIDMAKTLYYAILGGAMAVVFGSRNEFTKYLETVGDPTSLMKMLSMGITGSAAATSGAFRQLGELTHADEAIVTDAGLGPLWQAAGRYDPSLVYTASGLRTFFRDRVPRMWGRLRVVGKNIARDIERGSHALERVAPILRTGASFLAESGDSGAADRVDHHAIDWRASGTPPEPNPPSPTNEPTAPPPTPSPPDSPDTGSATRVEEVEGTWLAARREQASGESNVVYSHTPRQLGGSQRRAARHHGTLRTGRMHMHLNGHGRPPDVCWEANCDKPARAAINADLSTEELATRNAALQAAALERSPLPPEWRASDSRCQRGENYRAARVELVHNTDRSVLPPELERYRELRRQGLTCDEAREHCSRPAGGLSWLASADGDVVDYDEDDTDEDEDSESEAEAPEASTYTKEQLKDVDLKNLEAGLPDNLLDSLRADKSEESGSESSEEEEEEEEESEPEPPKGPDAVLSKALSALQEHPELAEVKMAPSPITDKDFQTFHEYASAGIITNLASTGLGPVASPDFSKRLATPDRWYSTGDMSAAKFPVIAAGDGTKAAIAYIMMTPYPVMRKMVDANEKGVAELHKTYTEIDSGSMRLFIDKAFAESATQQIIRVLVAADKFRPARARNPPSVLYVSVSLGKKWKPNMIAEDSVGLATLAAYRMMPIGATLTGALDDELNLKPIGSISAKIATANDPATGPLIFPALSIKESSYEEHPFLKTARLRVATGSIDDQRLAPVRTVAEAFNTLACVTRRFIRVLPANALRTANRYRIYWGDRNKILALRLTLKSLTASARTAQEDGDAPAVKAISAEYAKVYARFKKRTERFLKADLPTPEQQSKKKSSPAEDRLRMRRQAAAKTLTEFNKAVTALSSTPYPEQRPYGQKFKGTVLYDPDKRKRQTRSFWGSIEDKRLNGKIAHTNKLAEKAPGFFHEGEIQVNVRNKPKFITVMVPNTKAVTLKGEKETKSRSSKSSGMPSLDLSAILKDTDKLGDLLSLLKQGAGKSGDARREKKKKKKEKKKGNK